MRHKDIKKIIKELEDAYYNHQSWSYEMAKKFREISIQLRYEANWIDNYLWKHPN